MPASTRFASHGLTRFPKRERGFVPIQRFFVELEDAGRAAAMAAIVLRRPLRWRGARIVLRSISGSRGFRHGGEGEGPRGRARFHGERPRGWFRRDECGRTLGEQIVSADVRPPERLRHGLVRDLPLADVQPCSQVLILGHRSFPSLRCQRERMA